MIGRGINAHLPSKSDIDKVVNIGCEWIRIDFDWRTLEPKRGSFNWSPYDNAVNYAKSKGLKIYVTLAYVPKWLNEDHRVCPDVFNWVYFCTKIASRYNTKIDVYSLWNEPNLKDYSKISLKDYIEIILKSGHNAIKSVNPNLQIAAGDISTLGSSDWYDWFHELKKHADLFDIFSWHVYAGSISNTISRYNSGKFAPFGWLIDKWKPFKWEIEDIRKKGKKIFITETGLKAKPSKYSELKAQRNFVRELEKLRKETKTDAIFIYDLKDYRQFSEKWGIFDEYEKPKISAEWLIANK